MAAKSRDDCIGDLCSSADGNSGTIKVSRGTTMKEVNQTVRINFEEISEKDADGYKVGTTGSEAGKHSFKTFKDLGLKFSDLESTTVNVCIRTT